MEYAALEPFFNPVQVRLLVALRDGPQSGKELAARVDRGVKTMGENMAKLRKAGMVGVSGHPKKYRLRHDWNTTVDIVREIIETHLRGRLLAVEDLRYITTPPEAATGQEDVNSFRFQVQEMWHGP